MIILTDKLDWYYIVFFFLIFQGFTNPLSNETILDFDIELHTNNSVTAPL